MKTLLDEYDYTLPPELVAHAPCEPRENARLLVYDTARDEVTFCHVRDLPTLVPGALMVVNDTTVVPARLRGSYEGAPIELLVLVDQGVGDDGTVRALVNQYVKVGSTVVVPEGVFVVLDNREKAMVLRYEGGAAALAELLERYGETPLPPYIHSEASEAVRRTQYQTVFASGGEASVAAPTASLHFTPGLLRELETAGVSQAAVTLQVGLGTFAPVFPDNFERKQLHEEHYFVPAATARAVAGAKAAGQPVFAVGTTVVRTLESAKEAVLRGEGTYGTTDLFIFPPYQFSVPDVLMTNFHVPKSSLMCLVDAFLYHKGARRRINELYELAIAERFRFYSFGDAMLIL